MQSIKNILFVLLMLPLCLNGQEKFWHLSDTIVSKNYIMISKRILIDSAFFKSINIDKEIYYISKKLYYFNWSLKEEYCENESFLVEGNRISYYENGVIKDFYTCRNGNRVGAYIEFHDNGEKKTLGEYTLPDTTPNYYTTFTSDTTIDSSTGEIRIMQGYTMHFIDKKNGKWYYWNDKGILIKSELWDKGTLIK